jgi:hypothetical protein
MGIEPNHLFELTAFIASIINYHKIKNNILWWFIPFLLLVNLVEWGIVFKFYIIDHSNNWIYNIFDPLEFCFYSFIYYRLLSDKKNKKLILYLVTVILLFTIIDYAFIEPRQYLDSYSYILGCMAMVLYCFLYFRQVMQNIDENSLFANPYFWISSGLFLFSMGEAILFSCFQYFLITHNFSIFQPVFNFLSNVLIAILYTCLCISFFCRSPQQKA